MPSLGCIADIPDVRDFRFEIPAGFIAKLERLELPSLYTIQLPLAILDQGNIGSCVSHGVRTAFNALRLKENQTLSFEPSRLFIYYTARSIEHTRQYDSGCQVRDGLKGIVDVGVSDEAIWAYRTDLFDVHPPHEAYKTAFESGHRGFKYHRVNGDLYEIKAALYSGLPVVIGFSVYTSFFGTPSSGEMLPTKGSMEGGHCVTIEGWNDTKQRAICRNSWGSNWGAQGFFYMPYDFLISENVFDLWVLNK